MPLSDCDISFTTISCDIIVSPSKSSHRVHRDTHALNGSTSLLGATFHAIASWLHNWISKSTTNFFCAFTCSTNPLRALFSNKLFCSILNLQVFKRFEQSFLEFLCFLKIHIEQQIYRLSVKIDLFDLVKLELLFCWQNFGAKALFSGKSV